MWTPSLNNSTPETVYNTYICTCFIYVCFNKYPKEHGWGLVINKKTQLSQLYYSQVTVYVSRLIHTTHFVHDEDFTCKVFLDKKFTNGANTLKLEDAVFGKSVNNLKPS
jgi:hypothetical protein